MEPRRAGSQPSQRGPADYFTACLDLGLGVAGPLLGLVASHAGLGAVYLASTIVVASAALVALQLMMRHTPAAASHSVSPGA